MNSSPPAPSYTLPLLRSSGKFPITPSPTPSPNEERTGLDLGLGLGVQLGGDGGTPTKSRVKGQGTHDVDENGGRVSGR
jgi:hypothetical protein